MHSVLYEGSEVKVNLSYIYTKDYVLTVSNPLLVPRQYYHDIVHGSLFTWYIAVEVKF